MARSDDFAIFHRQGLISDREIKKAASRGAIGRRHLDEPEHQRDARPGFGETTDWGPDDLGHIDAKANRRPYSPGRQPLPRAGVPSVAQARRSSADEYYAGEDSWYGEPARRQE